MLTMVCTQVCNFVSTNRKEVANMKRIFIVGAKRTPIGKFGGSLSTFSASELGAKVISAVLKQSKLPKEKIDQILIGNVLQAGQGQNPARTASRLAGLPESIPAITINDVCGSGLSSVNLGASLIMSGQAEVVLVGGMESMSNAPYLLDKARVGYKMGDGILIDSMLKDSLIDSIGNYHMGMTAENISSKYSITRGEMDKYAVESHQKATYTTEYGGFKKEIVDIKVNPKGGAIALGHPVGASGSRILTTLIYELIENKGNYGIASLCIGGGMGAATLIKNANSNL